MEIAVCGRADPGVAESALVCGEERRGSLAPRCGESGNGKKQLRESHEILWMTGIPARRPPPVAAWSDESLEAAASSAGPECLKTPQFSAASRAGTPRMG